MKRATPGRTPLAWRRLVPVLVLALAASGCGGPFAQSAMEPASDVAQRQQDLFEGIFWWAVAVFALVEGALLLTILRFRAGRGGDHADRPRHVHGNTLVELTWTLAPAVVLVMIAVPTIATIWEIDRSTQDPDALVVEVVGHQWWWEFRYPDLGVVTANEMHIPVGRTVDLRLSSADVIHSFWIPRLAGKRDVVPGHETQLWFAADSTGSFIGQCAEFCGLSHALMKLVVVVDDPAEFEAWVETQSRPSLFVEAEGRDAFMTRGCLACHRIDGTPAQGVLGPDLSHVGSRGTIAAGILGHNAVNMARWLRDPAAVKPGALMPDLQLSDEDISALTAYLAGLR